MTRLEGQGMKDKKIRELASKIKSLNITYEKDRNASITEKILMKQVEMPLRWLRKEEERKETT